MSGRQLTELETVENWAADMMVDFRVSEGVSFIFVLFYFLSTSAGCRITSQGPGRPKGWFFFFISFPLKASLNFL